MRLNEVTGYIGSDPGHLIVDQDDLVTWDQLEAAVRAFVQEGNLFRRVEDELTPEQRRQIQSR